MGELFFGFFHISHYILDVIRGTVSAVSVLSNPQVGFIVGVKILVISFKILYQCPNVLVLHCNSKNEILPEVGVALELELYA